MPDVVRLLFSYALFGGLAYSPHVSADDRTAPVDGGMTQSVEGYRAKGASITWIAPVFSQLVSTSMPKGFNAVPVYEATLPGPRYMRENVLEGENENEWTQMITITGAKDLASNPDLTPQKFVERMAAGYKRACPDTFSAAKVPLGNVSGYEAFGAVVSCGKSPLTQGRTSESAMIIGVKGERDYYTVQWAERSAASATPIEIDAAKWMQRLSGIGPIKICAIVPGEAAPYPSCAKK
jgi:hypothetical protein